jgi:hypothetical protein
MLTDAELILRNARTVAALRSVVIGRARLLGSVANSLLPHGIALRAITQNPFLFRRATDVLYLTGKED